MKAMLIVAHGSRRDSSNDEVRQLADELRQAGDFDLVESAFLELVEPSIPDGIRLLAEAGALQVVVVPYFLSTGRHVVEDVPREVETGRALAPNVEVLLAGHLGASPGVSGLMAELARAVG